MNGKNTCESQSEILLYQTEDGEAKVEVRLEGETVCLLFNFFVLHLKTSISSVKS
ncbi:MAG: hypothetical protein PVG30_08555 [Gammaproteobacteria bacterium]|jgi:hypothetical protein